MAGEREKLVGRDEFYEIGDRDPNRPIRIKDGEMLLIEPVNRRGGPSGRTRGYRVVPGSRVKVSRIGRADREFTFPPVAGQTPIIFPRIRR